MKVFDAHVHIFPDKIAQKATAATGSYYGVPMYTVGSYDNIKKELAAGKMQRCLIHSTATRPDQVRSVNDYIAQLCAQNDCFVGFGTMHPDYEDIDGEERRMDAIGLLGIKLHSDFQGFAVEEKRAYPIYESARGRLPILFHMGDRNTKTSRPKGLAKVLDDFPDLTVIAAHLGGFSVWDEAEEQLIGRKERLYLDISSSLEFMDLAQAKRMILKHGTDRVLFGSDFPMHDPFHTLELFLSLGLSDDDNENILWNNAQTLLDKNA